MKILLDTHAILWAITRPSLLGHLAEEAMNNVDNKILISAVSPWEMAIKHRAGKLPQAAPLLADFDAICEDLHAQLIPIETKHGIFAGQLDWPHKDPFDRMLAAQAILEGAVLISRDRVFATYSPLAWLW